MFQLRNRKKHVPSDKGKQFFQGNYQMLGYRYFIVLMVLLLQACAAVNTFPTIARSGDTVSVMIGGSEKARKETVAVTLTDANNMVWDLKALNLVRSVFNLRADGRASGMHYSSYPNAFVSWGEGHEPLQTVMVIDLPDNLPAGNATLSVDTLTDDDSSGIARPYHVNIEVLPGAGSADNFLRNDPFSGYQPADFASLEPAPHGKIDFGMNDGVIIGAASLVVDFDETVVNPDDLDLYVPQSNVRGSFASTGAFGATQRMVYWHTDGQQVFISIVAPQGIRQVYLMMYLLHPAGISGSPGFAITSSHVYDVDGNELSLTPVLNYYP